MKSRRLALVVCGTLTLAACAIGRPVPQATTYIVDPPINAVAASVPRRPETLRMGHVRVAMPYAGTALVYRLDDVRYAADPYHAFVADPGAMLGNRIAEWLEREGPFSTVAQPDSTQPAPYVLEANIVEFYGDFREGRAPTAVLTVQFVLIEQVSARPKVRYERTIARRESLPSASPDALVRGYGTALGEILSEVAPELDGQIAH
jgi:cholesterol transport system auxiliary component